MKKQLCCVATVSILYRSRVIGDKSYGKFSEEYYKFSNVLVTVNSLLLIT